MISPSITKSAPKIAWRGNISSSFPVFSDPYGVLCVTLSVLILCYSGLISVVPILILYAIWLPRFRFKGVFLLKPTKNIFLSLCFAALCLLSAFWSNHATGTAYRAVQFGSMLLCTILMARLVSPKAFVKGLMLGTSLVLAPVLFIDGVSSLFGSKNQIGLIAEIGLFSSCIYFFTQKMKPNAFAFTAFCVGITGTSLIASNSATSQASLLAVLVVSYLIYLTGKLAHKSRTPALLFSLFFVFVLTVIAYYTGMQSDVLETFGKEATLTGRTYLWQEGLKVGLENPILGRGLHAFWVPGEPLAEKYWEAFYITGKAGFHFHNLFIQIFVDLGIVGFLIMSALVLTNFIQSLRNTIQHGAHLETIFFLGLAFMILLRSFAEVDVIGPFGIGPLLLHAILPMQKSHWTRQKKEEPQLS